MNPPLRQIRAHFDARTVRVYQAYSPSIAVPAVAAQRFVPPFKVGRMTWIKPSLTWMMYRAGFATKARQEHVLAIDVTREGFENALSQACLAHFEPVMHSTPEQWQALLATSPMRVQWDPERTVDLQPLPWRAIQIGIGEACVPAYVNEWTVRIEDVTETVTKIHDLVTAGELDEARRLVPHEAPYPVSTETAARIGAALAT